jgi:hypothetical protein
MIHLIFTGMKTTTLLLLLLFLVNSSSAETFIPYTPDSLKKGDWVEIESVHYYPYVAPGIEEKVPWRAENIRRVIFKATVTDLNERSRACTIAGTIPGSPVSTILTAVISKTLRSITRWSANGSCASHTIGKAGKHIL